MNKFIFNSILLLPLLLASCNKIIRPLSEGYHNQLPEQGTRVIVWSNYDSAVGVAVTWLQQKRLRLVERAHLHEVLREQRIQLTNTPIDNESILKIGKLIGANSIVFIDISAQSNQRIAINPQGASSWTEYHLSVTVRGVDIETGEILWSGRAYYPRAGVNPEAGIIHLTQRALEHAWCPEGKWIDQKCQV